MSYLKHICGYSSSADAGLLKTQASQFHLGPGRHNSLKKKKKTPCDLEMRRLRRCNSPVTTNVKLFAHLSGLFE